VDEEELVRRIVEWAGLVGHGNSPAMRMASAQEAMGLHDRSWGLGQIIPAVDVIGEAVAAAEGAVDLVDDGFPLMPAFLNQLGLALRRQFEAFHDVDDLMEAIDKTRQALALA
jgi:hypothetical protein